MERLNKYLENLRNKKINFSDDDRLFLSNKSIQLLNEKDIDVDELDTFIRICNIVYNNTTDHIIDDEIYDSLMIRYKNLKQNYQVGSEEIRFDNLKEDIIEDDQPSGSVKLFDWIPQEISNKIQKGIFTDNIYNIEYNNTISDGVPIDTTNVDKRLRDTSHNHPTLVGTLDKCKFVLMKDAEEKGVLNDPNTSILERDFFIKHIQDGIITPYQELSMVLELKYDGVSVEADCTNIIESARSRGDTGMDKASDLTPLLYGYPLNDTDGFEKQIGVKFEAVISKTNIDLLNKRKGYLYKNGRTAISGLMSNSDAPLYRDLIDLIPITIDRDDIPANWNRIKEIDFCNKYFARRVNLKYTVIKGNYMQCLFQIKKFLEETDIAREYCYTFQIDGIVISYLDESIRQRLGRQNFVNKYSVAVKYSPLKKKTIFRGYKYTVGKNGVITPMIYYDPVIFMGTVHNHSTGSSLERFKSLNLRKGDVLDVEYTNDVMPYVYKANCTHNINNTNPLEKFPTICPSCGKPLVYSDSGKTAKCTNVVCSEMSYKRLEGMLDKLGMSGFSSRSAIELINHGIRSFSDLMNITDVKQVIFLSSIKEDYNDINIKCLKAESMYNHINRLKTEKICDYVLVGSLGFSNIGKRKWKIILEHYYLTEIISFIKNNALYDNISKINGIGKSICDTIMNEANIYIEDMIYISSMNNIINSKDESNNSKVSVRCTGFRDKEFMEYLSSIGYDAPSDGGNVTKTTDILLIPYDGYKSSKFKKIGDKTKVYTIEQFRSIVYKKHI